MQADGSGRWPPQARAKRADQRARLSSTLSGTQCGQKLAEDDTLPLSRRHERHAQLLRGRAGDAISDYGRPTYGHRCRNQHQQHTQRRRNNPQSIARFIYRSWTLQIQSFSQRGRYHPTPPDRRTCLFSDPNPQTKCRKGEACPQAMHQQHTALAAVVFSADIRHPSHNPK